jgi:heme A synthase
MALFAVLLALATTRWRPAPTTASPGLQRLTLAAALGIYLVLLIGAAVASTGASWACLDFPLCGDRVVASNPALLESLHMTHRIAAVLAGSLVLLVAARCRRHAGLRRAAAVALALTLMQIAVGVAQVLLALPLGLRGLHLAMGTAAWGSLVVLATLAVSRGEATAQGRL